ncbi:integrase, catalytic region, zinc finger, CCHC-type containing protein [Tanacetum coccineum]
MSILAEFMIVAGADNRPPMLDKPQSSTRCYALVNHHKVAKYIWERVKLLMQGTSLSKKECECKLYAEFDKFSYVKEWGKFVTDVKLARDLHTSNYDQLYAYLEQHELVSQLDLGLAVSTFLPSDDPIACMNKAIAFLSAVFTPLYPSTNNQIRSSSNLRNQATVQDGSQGNASGSRGNTSGQVKVIKCYNCQGEGHMARQCTHPKRKRDVAWFKEKVLLIKA